ncbi:MAG: hypothetical protein PHN88_15895 [Ignavibacteria bacterium]|nr:hypothetical protein [Ignavibacteria bacterium]
MNPILMLQNLVDTTEKLYTLPPNEITQNGKLVDEMRAAMGSHNIDGIINAVRNSVSDFVDRKTNHFEANKSLLHAYAQREHARVKEIAEKNSPKPYFTKIINADDTLKDKPIEFKGAAQDNFVSAFNSIYANGALKINTIDDPSLLMSYIDYSPYRVNFTEYLSVPTLSEMVDRPIQMAMKKPAAIKSENEDFIEEVEKKLKKVDFQSVLKDAIFYSVLSPRGSLLVPIRRDKRITFNVFNDTQFAYGMGSSYSTITTPYNSVRVGDLYCLGAKLKHGVSAYFTCPGYEPLFGVGLNRIPQLRAAAEAWNLYIHVLKILLVRAQVIVEKMEGDIQTDTMLSNMRAQLQRLSQTMGVSTPIAQSRGTTLDIMNNNISQGTTEVAGVFRDFIASVTGMAPEYFFGGGNTNYSQAAFQIASTNENIHARYQVGLIEPLMRFAINTVIRNDEEIAKMGVEEDDFEIEFDSIYEATEQEKVDLTAKKTEILIRQRDYSELAESFKKLDLLDEDIDLEQFEPDHNADDNLDSSLDGESGDSKLTGPLGNTVDYDPEQLKMGIKIEMEHTDNPKIAEKIAKDHLDEFKDYYTRLTEMERKAKAEKPLL